MIRKNWIVLGEDMVGVGGERAHAAVGWVSVSTPTPKHVEILTLNVPVLGDRTSGR